MNKILIAFCLISTVLISCSSDPAVQYTYKSPEKIDDGINVGTLDEVNLEVASLKDGIEKIYAGKFPEVHSILILRNNKLVFEEYFSGHKYQWDGPSWHGEWVKWDRSTPHEIMSDTKSIVSAAIGIAVGQRLIESVHQSIFDYLPDYQQFKSGGKEGITIEHLLTMTSGLEWNEWDSSYTDAANDGYLLWIDCEDQIACILEKPLIHEPGTTFNYNGGNMSLLAAILQNAAGLDIEEFSGKFLFEPLGIDAPLWARYESGVIDGSYGIKLMPRDMAKVGLTFLNKGVWEGERIISEDWVEKSAEPFPGNEQIKVPGTDSGMNGYTYTWWTDEYTHKGESIHMFYAGGWGGQDIMVLPELDAVVVFTGGNYATKVRNFTIFERYILPAFE